MSRRKSPPQWLAPARKALRCERLLGQALKGGGCARKQSLSQFELDYWDRLLWRRPHANRACPRLTFLKQSLSPFKLFCDTAVTNIAGALGVPAWALTELRSDWRWHSESGKAPSLSARVFRQHRSGVWTRAVADVRDALQARLR